MPPVSPLRPTPVFGLAPGLLRSGHVAPGEGAGCGTLDVLARSDKTRQLRVMRFTI